LALSGSGISSCLGLLNIEPLRTKHTDSGSRKEGGAAEELSGLEVDYTSSKPVVADDQRGVLHAVKAVSLPHFAESAAGVYKIAMTPPMGPVLLVADSELQEKAIPDSPPLRIPKLPLAQPPGRFRRGRRGCTAPGESGAR
jgi:hypothetical protein